MHFDLSTNFLRELFPSVPKLPPAKALIVVCLESGLVFFALVSSSISFAVCPILAYHQHTRYVFPCASGLVFVEDSGKISCVEEDPLHDAEFPKERLFFVGVTPTWACLFQVGPKCE